MWYNERVKEKDPRLVEVHTRLSSREGLGWALLELSPYHGSATRAATAMLRRYLVMVEEEEKKLRQEWGDERYEEVVNRLAEELCLHRGAPPSLPEGLGPTARIALLERAERKCAAKIVAKLMGWE